MAEAKLLRTGDVPVGEIIVGPRLRPVSDAALDGLIASIRELGAIKDPIHLRETKKGLYLVAGAHRHAAARVLGFETIEAKVWRCSDTHAALMEIDDNLAHAELSPLELAIFAAERKRIYETLHPESRAGHAGAAMRWNSESVASFAEVLAEKRGVSARQVRKLIAAGEKLDPRDRQLLRAAPRPPTLKDLLALSKVDGAAQRYDVVEAFAAGRVKTIAQAMKRPAEAREKNPVEDAVKALTAAWKRAPMAARRRFIDEIGGDLLAMQESEADI